MKGSTKVASLPSAPAFCRKRASRRRSPPLLPRTTTKRLAPEDAALSLRPAEASANRSLADTLGVRPLRASELQWPTRPRPAETGSRRPQRVTPDARGTRSRGVRGRAPLSPAPGRGTARVLSADPGVACRHGNLSRLWCRAARAVVVVRRVSGADGGRGAAERHYRRVRPHRVGARPQRAPRPRVRALGGAALV
jgi:hypothetical protein